MASGEHEQTFLPCINASTCMATSAYAAQLYCPGKALTQQRWFARALISNHSSFRQGNVNFFLQNAGDVIDCIQHRPDAVFVAFLEGHADFKSTIGGPRLWRIDYAVVFKSRQKIRFRPMHPRPFAYASLRVAKGPDSVYRRLRGSATDGEALSLRTPKFLLGTILGPIRTITNHF